MNDNTKSSWWKEFLNFLWDGGFKSLIVLVTLAGAVWITVDNDRICKGAPTSNSNSTSLVQPNPICAKYFELVFMIVGGYLGLSVPSSVNSNLKTTNTDPKDPDPSLKSTATTSKETTSATGNETTAKTGNESAAKTGNESAATTGSKST